MPKQLRRNPEVRLLQRHSLPLSLPFLLLPPQLPLPHLLRLRRPLRLLFRLLLLQQRWTSPQQPNLHQPSYRQLSPPLHPALDCSCPHSACLSMIHTIDAVLA